VIHERCSLSVLLNGEAGCGKTHLLSRLQGWLSGQIGAPPLPPPAAIVAIRMETAPSQIWRHIRRRFAEQLTRHQVGGTCALDAILDRFAAPYAGDFRAAVEASELADLSHDLFSALEHFRAGTERRLCRAWLSGDGLSDADLSLLNLPLARPEEVEEDYAESSARRMVLAITRMSAPSPLVFFFDQVEALGIAAQGERGFALFARAGAALVDGSINVLMISTVLSSFLRDLQDGSTQSDYDRISKWVMDLHPLTLKQGSALIDSRLALAPEIQGQSPIQQSALESIFSAAHGSCCARRLIHEARRLFAQWQEIAPAPEETLDHEFERVWAQARDHPEAADTVLAHGLPAAFDLLGIKTLCNDAGIVAGNGASRANIVFINQTNMTSLAAALKRLVDKKTSGELLCLLRDQRLPIGKGAKITLERLKTIEGSGGRFIRVEAEALTALDAMRRLLTSATSGDLSLNGEAVDAKTVREWLSKNLPPEVERLASELLGEAAAAEQDINSDALLELVGLRKVVSVDEASQTTSWSKEKIEEYARTHPLLIRWFGGSCPVVCLAFAAASATETDYAG
jgi:hypothetical protein